jgi:hypothetical protein
MTYKKPFNPQATPEDFFCPKPELNNSLIIKELKKESL